MNKEITRRDFLRDTIALGALGLTGCANFTPGVSAAGGTGDEDEACCIYGIEQAGLRPDASA